MTEPLINRYRPRTLDEVIGQPSAVAALETLLQSGDSQAFLFVGPAGCGKTSLARIVARELGCGESRDIMEIDAATHTGIDAMRRIQEVLQYIPFDAEKRGVLLDEAHALSQQAWKSLLKPIEEPPAHVLWLLCTTDVGKVPHTIQTRCSKIVLKLVPNEDLYDLLDYVCEQENIRLADGVDDVCVKEANGSPRQLLANIGLCRNAADRRTAAAALHTALESDRVIDLCRALSKGANWSSVAKILADLDGENPESIRIIVVNYFAKVARSAKSDRDAFAAVRVLDAFASSYNASDGIAPLYVSVGRVLLE